VDVGCATAVYFVIAKTRGKCVQTAFLAGAKPKMWLSDRLLAQLRHAEEHQLCLAHYAEVWIMPACDWKTAVEAVIARTSSA
jgi:hypothetical protein